MLKVSESYVSDAGHGRARIGHDSVDMLSASAGDAIEINGKSRTVAKRPPPCPSDEGKGIII